MTGKLTDKKLERLVERANKNTSPHVKAFGNRPIMDKLTEIVDEQKKVKMLREVKRNPE